ncbi:hypothetical protein [Deinococcus ruber]|uniref:Uncharacterized protein n=1 Tax=Deinococcus ruber TaxID=1848197 RepID=A0A918CCK9_9DEIO|nr:hypothetical protein [Deinococcus ruber]GGR16847.1 hypothetical protein GCM10008957_31860 [Deinococcus ruber]
MTPNQAILRQQQHIELSQAVQMFYGPAATAISVKVVSDPFRSGAYTSDVFAVQDSVGNTLDVLPWVAREFNDRSAGTLMPQRLHQALSSWMRDQHATRSFVLTLLPAPI